MRVIDTPGIPGVPNVPGVTAELVARSNRLGAEPRNTNYAGGNTSTKGSVTDPVTQQPVELVWVKGSGGDLGTLTETGLAVLRQDRRYEPRGNPADWDAAEARVFDNEVIG